MPQPSRCPRCGNSLTSVRTFRDEPGVGPVSYLIECGGACDATMTVQDAGGIPVTFRRQVI